MYKKISDLKLGDLFHFVTKSTVFINGEPSSPLYIRGDFERSSKKYSCIDYNDSCHERFVKGSTLVWVY